MFDGLTMEQNGLPSVVICTEPFVPTAKSIARIKGIPDYRFVIIPDPLGSRTPEEVKELARMALPETIEILMGQS